MSERVIPLPAGVLVRISTVFAATLLSLIALSAPARAWEQWANRVINFSTEYSTPDFGSVQILDLPDVSDYGDNPRAWTPSSEDGTQEYITVGFRESVHADGAYIVESSGNGFVSSIDVLDTGGTYHTVWTGTDPSQPGQVVSFHPTWTTTSYLVQGLRIHVNTNHSSSYEEIDAVKLTGTPDRVLQWAGSVIDVSSEFDVPPQPNSSVKALGEPDVIGYNDNGNAWTPKNENGGTEHITVGFASPVYASGAVIRETYGNGFVTRIDALDTGGTYHQVWTGTDPTAPGAIGWFAPTWTQTAYAVQGLRVYIDTNHDLSAWEEIDALYMIGQAAGAPVPVISSLSPATVYRESADFTITVNGSNLLNTSVVNLNGSARPTTWVSGTQLTAQIPAADVASPGSLSITVFTPTPGGGTSNAATLTVSTDLAQWASLVLGASSSFAPTGDFSPYQALGAPDVAALGDDPHAWTIYAQNSGIQSLTLGYNRIVQADAVIVRESNAPGFVQKVDLLDTDGVYHTIWTGTDPSLPGALRDYRVNVATTAYQVWGARIWVDSGRYPTQWPEIDAVQLLGVPIPVPVPAITGFGRSPLLKGGPACTLVVNGTGFTPASVLKWNGAVRPTTFIKPAQIVAALSATDVAANATVSVTVYTPGPGGGTSSPVSLGVGGTLWGDIHGDSTLNLADAKEALKIAAGLATPVSIGSGDVAPDYPTSTIGYGDGRINVLDAVRILRRVLTGQ